MRAAKPMAYFISILLFLVEQDCFLVLDSCFFLNLDAIFYQTDFDRLNSLVFIARFVVIAQTYLHSMER